MDREHSRTFQRDATTQCKCILQPMKEPSYSGLGPVAKQPCNQEVKMAIPVNIDSDDPQRPRSNRGGNFISISFYIAFNSFDFTLLARVVSFTYSPDIWIGHVLPWVSQALHRGRILVLPRCLHTILQGRPDGLQTLTRYEAEEEEAMDIDDPEATPYMPGTRNSVNESLPLPGPATPSKKRKHS